MASLEHVSKDGRNCYRLRFSLDKKRNRIGLGQLDEFGAIEAKEHVEHLITQRDRNRPPSAPTLLWADSIPGVLHDKLSALGLLEPRKRIEMPRTVVAYMRAYIKSRSDWKKPENYRQAVEHLLKFLKRDVPLTGLTKGDVERWQRWMITDAKGPKLSANTAGQNIKRCRQMMRQAIDDKLVEENPFASVKIDLRSDKSKNRFVNASDTKKILNSCPDQEWRTIVALGRYGGLRCPSEVLKLRWSDIDWESRRFKVTAPKTQRYGKGERVVPLFPELAVELQDLASLAEPGLKCASNAYVIQRYRGGESNLRTTFCKIVERAKVLAFPKPFMALRASRRTELERSGRFANHVLNEWFGHSGAIAETHYLSVTEDDFSEASAAAIVPTSDTEGTSVGTSADRLEESSYEKDTKKPGKNRVQCVPDSSGYRYQYTPEDSNL